MLSIQRDILLAPFSTFKIGGRADYFVSVTTSTELIEAIEYATNNGLKTFVFSGGSNLLISDAGFRGIVIRIANKSMRKSGFDMIVDAGASLLTLVTEANTVGFAGIERLAGIPGSVGGAIRGNAGAFGTEIEGVVSSVKVYDRKLEKLREFNRKDGMFRYRASFFKDHPEFVILSAKLRFEEGKKEDLERISRETITKREAKHPQNALCAGSFFMNPEVTDETLRSEFAKDTGKLPKDAKLPAGWLIDQAGLRGKKIGGAEVSQIHPNYLINTGTATAEEVLLLAGVVKQRVRTELGIQLMEEVQLVGF